MKKKPRKIISYFLAGTLTAVPAAGTVIIALWLFKILQIIVPFNFIADVAGISAQNFIFKSAGILLTVFTGFFLIVLIGFVSTNIIGKKLFFVWDSAVKKIPVLGHIYLTLKQFLEAVAAAKSGGFKKVVLIEYPRKGMRCLAFLTGDSSKMFNEFAEEELVNIFIPTTPNPTSGFFVMLPKKEVKVLDIKIEEGIKLIISAGVLNPEEKNEIPYVKN